MPAGFEGGSGASGFAVAVACSAEADFSSMAGADFALVVLKTLFSQLNEEMGDWALPWVAAPFGFPPSRFFFCCQILASVAEVDFHWQF